MQAIYIFIYHSVYVECGVITGLALPARDVAAALE
jgi:hypothetical protein